MLTNLTQLALILLYDSLQFHAQDGTHADPKVQSELDLLMVQAQSEIARRAGMKNPTAQEIDRWVDQHNPTLEENGYQPHGGSQDRN